MEWSIWVESRKKKWYILTLLILAWITSLSTGGFVDLIHYALLTYRMLPYLAIGINLLSTLVYLWIVMPKLVDMRGHSGPYTALADFVFILTLVFAGFLGFLYILFIVFTRLIEVEERKGYAVLAVVIIITIGAISILYYGPTSASHNIKAIHIDEPIEAYGIYRLTPLRVAYTYASEELPAQSYTISYTITGRYEYFNGSRLVYSWIIEPGGFINKYKHRPPGVAFVYADVYPPEVVVVEKELKYGFHNRYFKLFYTDSLTRLLELHALGYKILTSESVEVYYNGHVYIVTPIVNWVRGLLYSIPVPYAFALVDENGDVEILSFEKALTDPRLSGVPKVPEDVAWKWADLYKYSVGDYAIRDVSEDMQPFLVVSNNGDLYWAIIAEGIGESYLVDYIIYIPVDASEPHILVYSMGAPIMSVDDVLETIKNSHPSYDWGNVKISELTPIVMNNTIYWKATIVKSDYSEIVSIELVNGRTGQLVSYIVIQEPITADDLLAFMKIARNSLVERGGQASTETHEAGSSGTLLATTP